MAEAEVEVSQLKLRKIRFLLEMGTIGLKVEILKILKLTVKILRVNWESILFLDQKRLRISQEKE
jgi:hypothetical protein